MMSRYKPTGWQREGYRHSLAARGVKTKADQFVDILMMKDNAWIEKKAVPRTKADEFVDVLTKPDLDFMKSRGSGKTQKVVDVLTLQDSSKSVWSDRLKGGRADKKVPGDFDQVQLHRGVQVEREHTSDPKIAGEIAMDHLSESPAYYDDLARMERGYQGRK
jgi:hypothetical protein